MRMRASEAARRGIASVTRAAERSPVTITKHGRDVAVVVSAEQYRRLLDSLSSEHYLDDWASLAALFRDRREQLGWTLEETAQAATVGRRFVWDLEQGTARPEIALILRVASALRLQLTGIPTRAPGPWIRELEPPSSDELPEQS